MNGIGVMSSRTLPTNTEANIGLEVSSFTETLPEICKQAHIFCNQKYPGVVPLIHHLESSSGLTRPQYLGGESGVSSSMALSLDLVNSTHYDVNHGSVGFLSQPNQCLVALLIGTLFYPTYASNIKV